MGFSSSKQKSTPWKPAEEPLKQGIAQTQQAYAQSAPMSAGVADRLGGIFDGYAAKVGQTSPMLQGTNAALARTMRGDFLGANPGASTYGRVAGDSDPSIGLLSGMTGQRQTGDYSGFGGANNPAYGLLTSATSRGADGQAGAGYFRDVAAGKYLDKNPYLDSIINSTMDDVSNRVNARFGASGVGFGNSTDHSGLLSRELATASNNLRGQAYETERGRMGEAAGMLGEFDSRDRNFGLQAGSTMGSLWNTGEGLRLNALTSGDQARQSEFDGRTRAMGLLSDAWRGQQGLQLDAAKAGDAAYAQERDSMLRAAGLVPQMAEAEYAGISPLLALSSGLLSSPWAATEAYNDSIARLTSPYGTTKTRKSVMDTFTDAGNAAARAYSAGQS